MHTRLRIAVLLSTLILGSTSCLSVPSEEVAETQAEIMEISEPTVTSMVAEQTQEPMGGVVVPQTEILTLQASESDRDYQIFVALPETYHISKNNYPVIYSLDGHLTFIMAAEYSRWLSFGDIIPETIVVGIDNSSQRSQDLLPERQESVEKFLAFITQDLVPYIDGHYRTKPSDRTLSGASYGGSFTLYTLFHSPETFSRYIATTPAIVKDDEIFAIEENYASAHADLPATLFISVGSLEPTKFVEEIHDKLAGRKYPGLDMEMVILEDQGHITTIIEGYIEGLQAVFD